MKITSSCFVWDYIFSCLKFTSGGLFEFFNKIGDYIMCFVKDDLIDILENGDVPNLLNALSSVVGVNETARNASNNVRALINKIDHMTGRELEAVLTVAAQYISRKN